ncbi:MAG: DUF2442 domain-containing protein [Acidobacteriota bacterium]|nr:DUF2442 domain-containing protein [Acidobacteriota bacterium]
MLHRVRTTNEEIDAALERAVSQPGAPAVRSVRYHRPTEMIILSMSSGTRVAIPREEIQELKTAPQNKIAQIEIENFGTALHWPQLDLDLSVEGLVRGVTGTKRWMRELSWQRSQAKAENLASVLSKVS